MKVSKSGGIEYITIFTTNSYLLTLVVAFFSVFIIRWLSGYGVTTSFGVSMSYVLALIILNSIAWFVRSWLSR